MCIRDSKEIADSRRALLSFVVGSIAFIFVADTVLLIANAHMRMEVVTDILGSFNVFYFLMAATLAASVTFRGFGRKTTAASELMLPASDTEKFLSRWLITVPCTLLMLTAGAYAGDFLAAIVAKIIFSIGYRGTFGWSNYVMESLDLPMFVASLLFVQSFFFLGSLLWPRFSWCKSLIFLILFLALCVSVVLAVIYSFRFAPDMRMQLNIIGRDELIVIMLVLTVINYIISFFRFREVEIINRW